MERKASLVARLVGRNPVAADWLLAGGATLVCLGGAQEAGARALPAELWVLLAVAGNLPVAWRRRFPLGVLAVTELVTVVHLLLGFDLRAAGPGVGIALYTVATSCEWRASVRAVVVVVVLNAVVVLVRPLFGLPPPGPDVIITGLLLSGVWVVGDNVRTRRAYTAELEERAVRLEREREEQAVKAVAEERARIARELHDVVAHHVSVIAVQAGAVSEEATTDPVREALRLIQATSRQALTELRSLLDVLRIEEAAPELTPQPGLSQLDRLVAQSRAAGLPVELIVVGEPRALPILLDLAAYRTVQEALTNTLKHAGPARARVELRYTDAMLELQVTDDGQAAAGEAVNGSGGRGLVGMRERVALAGGALEAGPRPGGGFRVAAFLPINGGP